MKVIMMRFILISFITLGLIVTGMAQSEPTHAQSPTGHSPKLLWTPERQVVLNALRDDPKWGPILRAKADNLPRTATGDLNLLKIKSCFGCHGAAETMMYQMTGDITYAQKAWQSIGLFVTPNPPLLPADGSNGTRQGLMAFAIYYDWLKPALTDEQKQQFRNALVYWSKLTLKEIPGINFASGRLEDSDEVVGHYFGVVFTALTIQAEDPTTSALLLNHPHVGGFTATSNSLDNKTSTMRNALKRFSELAQGGEWIESSHYNPNTVMLMGMGYQGVKTATGTDHFPELKSYFKEAGIQALHVLTPDLKQIYQWGDEQDPHHLRLYGIIPHLAVLAGINENESTIGPLVSGAMNTLMNMYPSDDTIKSPPFNFFLFFNPAAPVDTNWQTNLARSNTTTSQGLTHFRTGWNAQSSFFTSSFLNSSSFVDHQQLITGDFQLYRKGEWAITHPIGYRLSSLASNVMRFSGFSATQEARGVIAQEVDPHGTYVYSSGTVGGSSLRKNYWAPPPTYLHEWTRSFLYLPSSDASQDTVVIYDRTLADDPELGPNWLTLNYEGAREIIKENVRKDWILHMNEAPTLTDNKASWKTENSQFMQLTSLLPLNTEKTVMNERDPVESFKGTMAPIGQDKERKFHLRIKPTQDQAWDNFLSVVTASDQATTTSQSLVESDNKAVQGVHLKDGSKLNVLALFSAKPGKTVPTLTGPTGSKYDPNLLETIKRNRLIQEPFALSATLDTPTQLYITDLDPAQRWSVKVNNTQVPFKVSENGLGRATIDATGNLSLAVLMNDVQPEGKAQLEVTVSADVTQAKTGDTITYQITYRNTGEKTATHAKFTTAIPTQFEVLESTLPTTPTVSLNTEANTLSWTIPAVPAGESGTVSLQVKVKPLQ